MVQSSLLVLPNDQGLPPPKSSANSWQAKNSKKSLSSAALSRNLKKKGYLPLTPLRSAVCTYVDIEFTVQTLKARELPPQQYSQKSTYLVSSCSILAEGGPLVVTSCSVITNSNQLSCFYSKNAKSLKFSPSLLSTSNHRPRNARGLSEDFFPVNI